MTTLLSQALRRPDVSSLVPEELSEAEANWVHFQPYLFSKGYQLRPRYRPGWQPSWKSTGANPYDCEDSSNALPVRTLDALRMVDNYQVIIKIIIPSDEDREGEEELDILRYLSSEQCRADPTNHAVQCLDTFPIPGVEGGAFCVMPLLTAYNSPPFYNLGELYDFLAQIFEGLQFLHKNSIAHCDIASPNIMMDGRVLYDEPFHPFLQTFTLDRRRQIQPKYRRSQQVIRYYYIDFGYAKRFQPSEQVKSVHGTRARERAPEQLTGLPYDPFKADIYQLGAIMRRDLIPRDDRSRSEQTTFPRVSQPNDEQSFCEPWGMENALADPPTQRVFRGKVAHGGNGGNGRNFFPPSANFRTIECALELNSRLALRKTQRHMLALTFDTPGKLRARDTFISSNY